MVIFGASIVLLLLIVAVFAPYLAPFDPLEQDLLNRRSPPCLRHPFGTDIYGRDMLSRVIFGSRVSLAVGVISVLIGFFTGSLCGLLAGYYGGILDDLIMRVMDILLALPSLILAMVVITALGPSLLNAMIAIGVWFAPNYARLARSSALSVRQKEFVEAARAIGCSNFRIIIRHILSNSLPSLIVYSTLNMGTAFLMEATLSFLGLGVQPPTPSWGAMVNEGRAYLQMAPHLVTIPGLVIMLAVAGFNTLGEGLRDILDPRSGFRFQ